MTFDVVKSDLMVLKEHKQLVQHMTPKMVHRNIYSLPNDYNSQYPLLNVTINVRHIFFKVIKGTARPLFSGKSPVPNMYIHLGGTRRLCIAMIWNRELN